MLRFSAIVGVLTLVTAADVATAQRADENAVTAAPDAFGTSIGFQNVGLYSPNDARGFSPQQAGNLRIEGLFFDQQTFGANDCVVRETTMRIGIAAQAYSFPAPTGIADYSLRIPGDKAVTSAVLTRGPFESETADVEMQRPVARDVLAIDVCASYRRDFGIDVFRRARNLQFGSTLRWKPAETVEVIPFASYANGAARYIVPQIYTSGLVSIPQFQTQDLATQSFTTWHWEETMLGAVGRVKFADDWSISAGIFESIERDALSYQPYTTLLTTQTADAEMDIAPPLSAKSTSGEIRLARIFGGSVHQETLQLAVRGRVVDRNFGGDEIIDQGTVARFSQAQFVPPAIALSPESHDHTHELDLGLTLEERWDGIGTAAVGVLRDGYRREVTSPSEPLAVIRTEPWLLNVRLNSERVHELAIYSGFVQGLEDSALAPVSAANRNEPPPATRSWQVDGGLRWTPRESLQALVGAFEIHKPYFNTGVNNIYRQLGLLDYRGLESSLSWNRDGLTLLAGGVYLKPHVHRTLVEPGATGETPIGPVPLTMSINLDWEPPRLSPWAGSLQWTRLSSRVETVDDSVYLPQFWTLNAGLRYRLKLNNSTCLIRLDGYNLTNARGLHLSSLELVVPEQIKRYMLTLAVDI